MAGSALFSAVCAQAVAPGHSSAPRTAREAIVSNLTRRPAWNASPNESLCMRGPWDFAILDCSRTENLLQRPTCSNDLIKAAEDARSRADLEKTIAEALDSHCTA